MRVDFSTIPVANSRVFSANDAASPAGKSSAASGCACGSAGCDCAGKQGLNAERDVVELSGAEPVEQENSRPFAIEGSEVRADNGDSEASESASTNVGETELTEEEEEQVRELQERDREVRAHEQAHLAAAGPYAKGGPTYEYQRGPDGRNYAVGGEVSIDTSPVEGDPAATIAKMNKLIAAAYAPAEPSGQDRAVAAQAAALRAEAQADLAAERTETEETSAGDSTNQPAAAAPESPASNKKPNGLIGPNRNDQQSENRTNQAALLDLIA